MSPSIYTIKGNSDAVYTKDSHDGTIQIERDDIRKQGKPTLTRFGLTFGVLSSHEKSFYIH